MFEKTILETIKSVLLDSALLKLPNISSDCIHITAYDQPPPTVGQYFILIHPESRVNYAEQRSEGPKNYVYDRVGFDIVCGARTRLAPTDRLATHLNNEYVSLGLIKDLIITIVSKTNSSTNTAIQSYLQSNLKTYHQDIYDVLVEGTNIIDGFEYTGSDAQPVPRRPDYFSATDSSESMSNRPAGHTYTCRFLSPSRIYTVQC